MSGSFDNRSIFPKFLRRAINRCADLLYEKTILVLVVLLLAGIASMVWFAFRVQSNLIKSTALSSASLYSQALTEFRSIYTSEVVARIRRHQVKVTHDYKKKIGAIPLPATLSMELGKRIGEHRSGAQSRLYSPFPFSFRKKNVGLKDDFAQKAWEFFKKNPQKPYFRFEEVQGRWSFRYATADLMRPDCVPCHNTHPDSPKRTWKVGDVRGVLEVIHPYESIVMQTRQGLWGVFFLFLFTIMGISGTAYAITRLKNVSDESENRASRLHIVDEIAKAVGSRLDPKEVFETIVREIRMAVPCERCLLATVDQENGNIHYWHTESDIEVEFTPDVNSMTTSWYEPTLCRGTEQNEAGILVTI